MTYKKNLIALGRGRVSSARLDGDTVTLILAGGGRLTKKSMEKSGRQVYGARVAGYSDDCWLLPVGRLERVGEELIYYANVGDA